MNIDAAVLTPGDVRNTRFTTTRRRPGYDQEEVDAFLDRVEAELDRLIHDAEEIRAYLTDIRHGRNSLPEPAISDAGLNPAHLTVADVRNTRFATTWRQPGYDQREVDEFLGRVEAELDRLTRIGDELLAEFIEIIERQYGVSIPGPPALPALPPADMAPGPKKLSGESIGCLLVVVLFFALIGIGAGVAFSGSIQTMSGPRTRRRLEYLRTRRSSASP